MLRTLLAVVLTIVAIGAAGWLSMRRADIPFETLEAAYTTPESEFINLDSGYKVHFLDRGAADAPVLLFVHGFGSSLHTWDRLINDLGTDYRLVAVDLPGHGLTRGISSDAISVEGFSAFLDEFSTKIGIEKFTLVGHGLGARAALAYAAMDSDGAEGLVLLGASLWPANVESDDESALIIRLLNNRAARVLLSDLDLSFLVTRTLSSAFHDNSHVTDGMVARYSALNRAPGHRDALLALTAPDRPDWEASPALLDSVSVPVLIGIGAQDVFASMETETRMKDQFPDARLHTYENAASMLHIEVSKQLAGDIRDFLGAEPPEVNAIMALDLSEDDAATN